VMQKIYPTTQSQPQKIVVAPEPTPIQKPEPETPQPKGSEYKVENLTIFGGFMIDPDTAYIDRALVVEWAETYGDWPINRVKLEVPSTGKSLECKFRPYKEGKNEGKGIVQISEKLQTALRIHKDSSLIIRPVLEPQEEKTNIETNAISFGQPDEQLQEEKLENTGPETFLDDKPASVEEFPEAEVFQGLEDYKQDAPVIQVIVDNLGGLAGRLGNPDFVRIDNTLLARWIEFFGEREFKEVLVEETTFGKEIRCKFQVNKDSQFEGKGIVQIPEKLQESLGTKKGALVLVKPVLE